MQFLLIVAGAWLGFQAAGLGGLVFGGLLGYLLGQVSYLKTELLRIEQQLRSLADTQAPPVEQAPRPTATEPREAEKADLRHPASTLSARFEETATATTWKRPATIDRVTAFARRWLTTGNVPVKLGVIILFFGVAFLLRYMVEQQILRVPIEFRLLGIAAIAAALLAVGWRLRTSNAVYALSLQGGGIGILYLTIFAAFRLYSLLPATPAFVLLVILTVAVGVLAVLQDARALAILATVGGFLAPVLTSTGQGSHVMLFSYYLLLNGAILGISWHRAWRSLNLIGFAFTFGIGSLWGYRYYTPEHFASTEPFLILYFLFYQAIAVMYAFRQQPDLRGVVDGTILFGTPVIAFALQSELVADTEFGLAISAAAVALFYVLLAGWLFRFRREQLVLMIESYAALAIAFGTIAIPLALDARWTAAAWALEGAALIWVGVRQNGLLARLGGAGLLVASGASFLNAGWQHDTGIVLLNGNALGGFLISAASLFGAYYLGRDARPHRGQLAVSVMLLVWGLSWWLLTGLFEIIDRAAAAQVPNFVTFFVAASAAALALAARQLTWTAARHATLATLPLLVLTGLLYVIERGHLFAGAGALAWPLAIAAHFLVLFLYNAGQSWREYLWHGAGAVVAVLALAGEAHWRLDAAGLNATWSGGTALLAISIVSWLMLSMQGRFPWPLRTFRAAYLSAAGLLVAMVLLTLTNAGIERPGDPAPLAYLPVLNPFDVVTFAGLVIAWYWLQQARATSGLMAGDSLRVSIAVWLLAAFVLTTIAVVRGVHHLAGVPWSEVTLMRSVSVQAALSIYWGLLGFAGMVFGARHVNRSVWIAGTVLMGLVVVKLFTVDLNNTGTVARIVSFLGIGGLLLVVGYFAPAPPRTFEAATTGTEN